MLRRAALSVMVRAASPTVVATTRRSESTSDRSRSKQSGAPDHPGDLLEMTNFRGRHADASSVESHIEAEKKSASNVPGEKGQTSQKLQRDVQDRLMNPINGM